MQRRTASALRKNRWPKTVRLKSVNRAF